MTVPDVGLPQAAVKLPHVLIVSPDPGADTPSDLPIEVECPNRRLGPRADCAAWYPCGCTAADPYEAADEPCPTSPTGEHRYLSGEGLCAPTARCFVAGHEALRDAVTDSDIVAGPGRYEVDYVAEDETGLVLRRWKESTDG